MTGVPENYSYLIAENKHSLSKVFLVKSEIHTVHLCAHLNWKFYHFTIKYYNL